MMPEDQYAKGLKLLRDELKRLQLKVGHGSHLKLVWQPNKKVEASDALRDRQVLAEVIGDTIYIYQPNIEDALFSLKHEFVEILLVSELVDPYADYIKGLERAFQETTYWRREKIVNMIAAMI